MAPYEPIDPKTAYDWLSNKKAIIIDVREPSEYNTQHIGGAKNIPLSQITPSDIDTKSDKKIIVHCQLGRRSSSACEKLLSLKPELTLYNLEGGISAWANANLPVIKGKGFQLSIDRQVQLTTGIGIVIGSTLGFLVHPAYHLISTFFGAGLIYAGISGNCTLATLLMKCPWNK